ncbi:MAG: endonuclease/exonuclease/phosphatase family protein [Bacilli bacterium]|nr:endonuclease/exonuclease/phosphatase family protein [Bacilli bacterium]MBN2877895.1 endonuclease/exonuclease/phosphatase family protein [Bacilli bacterium]
MDLVFLQEVAQTNTKSFVFSKVKDDNYALSLIKILQSKGKDYYLEYLPFKQSFGIYDEGLAILSSRPIKMRSSILISTVDDYLDWKTRYILSVSVDGIENVVFSTTHFGWSDGKEVFENQFEKAINSFESGIKGIIAGDFNISPESSEYKKIRNSDWHDLLQNEVEPTFKGDEVNEQSNRRIDYFISNYNVDVLHHEILFQEYPVSDHYGVYIEVEL